MSPSTGRRAARRTSPPRRYLVAAVTVLLVVALVGFLLLRDQNGDAPSRGSDLASGAASATSSATAGGADADASPTASATGIGDGTDDAISTPTELEPYALRGADLPPGWRTLDTVAAATSELIGECLRRATTPTIPHVLNTQSFRSGSDGPVLTSAIRDFTTTSQAKRAQATVRTQVTGCVNGTAKPALTPVRLASAADDSVAVEFTITKSGSSARGELIVLRVRQRTTTLVLIGLSAADLEVGRDAAKVAVTRMKAE